MHRGALVYRRVLPGTQGREIQAFPNLILFWCINGCSVLSGEMSAWMKSFA